MLRKAVMELLAVGSVAQSDWKKQCFISLLFKLKISGRNFICTFLNLLAKELGLTTENRPGFTIAVALVAHRTSTLMSRLKEPACLTVNIYVAV
jgi:hypothetical protein